MATIDMPPSSPRVRRAFRRRQPVSRRDWAELPLDAISAILHKLDHIEILTGGVGQVCRSWRRYARDEPELWRRIHMPAAYSGINQEELHAMTRAAVHRSKGQCQTFSADRTCDDDFLLFLSSQAPALKCLHLISCYDVSAKAFVKAIRKFPLLEELELSLTTDVFGMKVFETVGKACQQLKRFKLSDHGFYNFQGRGFEKDGEALGIATMTKLRSLEVFGNNLTNKGLTAILDNCPYLESLDISHCFNVKVDDATRGKCARIKTLRLL